MNRKTLMFAVGLFLLLALKFALAQDFDDTTPFEPAVYEDPAQSIFNIMMAAPLLGAVFGAIRILAQRSARPVVAPIQLN